MIMILQANSAKWEPPHGRFKHFFYPWSEYVKVGAVLRYCAYEVMALHGVLHSEIQVRGSKLNRFIQISCFDLETVYVEGTLCCMPVCYSFRTEYALPTI